MASALVRRHEPQKKWLYTAVESPLILQLGGSDKHTLAIASEKARSSAAYTGLNLNVGCPSPRVVSGQFGIGLFLHPRQVADCVAAMQAASGLTVGVKTRIGVDQSDRYEDLLQFVQTVFEYSGCSLFIIHARKAWLSGLNPKQNRHVPPLDYETVYRLKQDFPHLTIILNGGIQALNTVNAYLKKVDGVMIGRMAVKQPYQFCQIDPCFKTRFTILNEYLRYVEIMSPTPKHRSALFKPLHGLYWGQKQARRFRSILTDWAVLTWPQIRYQLNALSSELS